MTPEHLLSLIDVTKHFDRSWRQRRFADDDVVRAVDGVSLHILPGETFSLVGETGSGKTTLARCIMRTCDVTSGRVIFEGQDITNLSRRDLMRVRADIQMVFQDSHGALNPRRRICHIIGEPMSIHGVADRSELRRRVHELMELVGLNPDDSERFPAEFSGGQRQRIGIARALGLRPKLIVLDEPVSALDSSVQAQVLNLLMDLKSQFRTAYLLIAHDLSVVHHVSDRVAVMYAGRIVETATTESLTSSPRHHYTIGLHAAARGDPGRTNTGDSQLRLPPLSGCRFRPRCPAAQPLCEQIDPSLAPVDTKGLHYAACHYPGPAR